MFTLYESPNLEGYNKIIYLHPEVHSSQVLRLKNYIEKGYTISDRGTLYHSIKVEYKQKQYGKTGYGRFFPSDPSLMPASYQSRKVRTTLFENNEIDIDIVNAHPTIMACLYTIDTGKRVPKAFLDYIKFRDEIFRSMSIKQEAIDRYNETNNHKSDKDIKKVLYTACLYGQSLKGWETKYGLTPDEYTLHEDFTKYSNAVKSMTKTILSLPKYDQIKSDYAESKQIGVEDIQLNKLMSLLLQDWETKIVRRCMSIFKENGVTVRSYIYDGFQIDKSDKDIDGILKKVHTILKKEFKMNVIFIAKPFEESFKYTDEVVKSMLDREALVNLMDFYTEENCARLLKRYLNDRFVINDKILYEYLNGVWKHTNITMLKGKTRSCFIDYLTVNINSYMSSRGIDSPTLALRIDNDRETALLKTHKVSFMNNVFNTMIEDISTQFKLDSIPYLLNGPNGTLNFMTMKLQPHNKDDFISYSINCDIPDPESIKKEDFKEVMALIEEWVPGMSEYIMSVFGMALDGRPIIEKCLIMMGILSRNGKSTLVNLLKTCLNTYVGDLGFSWICEKNNDSNKPDPLIKTCIRRRLSFISEADDNCRVNEERFKKATGKDDFTYRDLYQGANQIETESFQSTLVFTTNSNLSFNNVDSAITNRLSYINFPNMFGDESQKFWDESKPNCKRLDIKLKTKIINGYYNHQLIKALLYYYQHPVSQPVSAKAFHTEIVKEMDSVGQWCSDYLVIDETNFNHEFDSYIIQAFGDKLLGQKRKITLDYLYSKYKEDLDEDIKPVNKNLFNNSLKQLYPTLYSNQSKTVIFGGKKLYYNNVRYIKFDN